MKKKKEVGDVQECVLVRERERVVNMEGDQVGSGHSLWPWKAMGYGITF